MTFKHKNKAVYYALSFDNKVEALKYIVETVKNHKQKDHGGTTSAEQRVSVSMFIECSHCHRRTTFAVMSIEYIDSVVICQIKEYTCGDKTVRRIRKIWLIKCTCFSCNWE